MRLFQGLERETPGFSKPWKKSAGESGLTQSRKDEMKGAEDGVLLGGLRFPLQCYLPTSSRSAKIF
jgi:hypothetical protein